MYTDMLIDVHRKFIIRYILVYDAKKNYKDTSTCPVVL